MRNILLVTCEYHSAAITHIDILSSQFTAHKYDIYMVCLYFEFKLTLWLNPSKNYLDYRERTRTICVRDAAPVLYSTRV